MKNNNRVIFISVSTQKGCFAGYFNYFLESLSEYAQLIVIISSDTFSKSNKSKYNAKKFVFIEDVPGDDYDRWAYGLARIVTLDSYSYITFTTDGIYGPIHSLDRMFETMGKRKCGLWGITNHMPISIVDGLKTSKFMQAYFFEFNTESISADEICKFFIEERDIHNEFTMLEYFETRGFVCDTYIDLKEVETNNSNVTESPILFLPNYLLEAGCPFLSRYMFSLDADVVQLHGDGMQIFNAYRYVKKETKYPIRHIDSDLVNCVNIYKLVNNLGLCFPIEGKRQVIHKISRKVAVYVYLFYEDSCYRYAKYINRVPGYIEVIIFNANSAVDNRKIQSAFGRKTNVVKVNPRGREWKSYLLETKDVYRYDICLFIHDKKFHSFEFPTQGISFSDLLWENLLPSNNGINSIIDVFNKNKNFGVLLPPIVKCGAYLKFFQNFWMDNFDNTVDICSKIGVRCDLLKKEYPPISIGSAFWFRPAALRKLLDYKFSEEDFPEEPLEYDGTLNHALERVIPYVAQDAGFMSAYIVAKDYLIQDYLIRGAVIQNLENKVKFTEDGTLFGLMNDEG